MHAPHATRTKGFQEKATIEENQLRINGIKTQYATSAEAGDEVENITVFRAAVPSNSQKEKSHSSRRK